MNGWLNSVRPMPLRRNPPQRSARWCVVFLAAGAIGVAAEERGIRLLVEAPDPYGFPRPGAGQTNVPLRTSFYVALGVDKAGPPDAILPESVAIGLQPAGGEPFEILSLGRRFAAGYSGRFIALAADGQSAGGVAVYVDPDRPLRPATAYTVRVVAKTRGGAKLAPKDGTWTFTTEAAPLVHDLSFSLDLEADPVRWQGGFFTGFCKPSFCTSAAHLIETYELMDAARRRNPRAWSLQRDFWMTGLELRPTFLSPALPNVVRERETRRITAIENRPGGTRLRVEDFFGHEQYGIPSGRPVSEDYHAGDEVLIADGIHDARTKVITVDDAAREVLVAPVPTPGGGWKIAYDGPLPIREDPNAPGLFPPGGCYLLKFRPHGTPCYYWGRLDREFDIAHRRFGRRLSPNFADAPGDLAVDGRNWTTAKDYAELHEAVRAMTGHLIDRYGDACLDFVWSVFNEPDLGRLFWRSDWTELQRFYDYATDAILRAFEDRGRDSGRVFIGGLELGAVFGTNLKAREFLAHCSPRGRAPGALPENAAFADRRLDGRRSRRVEDLCRAHGGRGSPCDFISIHAYNRSEVMAAKLARAKEIALEIDAEYYAQLRVNSHEACPSWNPPPDPAAADSYLGNGYYPTWCADVVRRQLARAAKDPRFAYGETILTCWPWPNDNFGGNTACTRRIRIDDDGDGRADRSVVVPMPIFHFLTLLAGMDGAYQVLPEQVRGGHIVSGFASRGDRRVYVLLYAHHALDTESRSDRALRFSLDVAGVPWPRVRVEEYRFGRDHNSYYRLGRRLRDRAVGEPAAVDAIVRDLEGGDRTTRLAALKKLASLGPAAHPASASVIAILGGEADDEMKAAALATLQQIGAAAVGYSPAEVGEVQALSALRVTASTEASADASRRVRLTAELQGNEAAFLVIEPG